MTSFNETFGTSYYQTGKIAPAQDPSVTPARDLLQTHKYESQSFSTITTTPILNFYWEFLKLYAWTGLAFYTSSKHWSKFSVHPLIQSTSETLFFFLTFVLSAPVLCVCLIVNSVVRIVLTLYFKLNSLTTTAGRIELMNGNDGFWAYDEFANSCNFTSLLVMEGKCDVNKIQTLYSQRILDKLVDGKLFYEKLRNIPVTSMGYFCWKEDLNFNVKNHIRYLDERNPCQVMTENQVFQEIQKLIDYPMPDEHAKWEFLLVPHYVYNDPTKSNGSYFAMIIRMHHSYTDGISGSHVLRTGFADSPPKLALDPLKPIKVSFGHQILIYASMLFLGPKAFFRTVMLDETNCFHSGKTLTGPKSLGWSKPLRLDSLKQIRSQTKCTTMSIFVSCLVGAMKTIGTRKGFVVPKLIHAFPTIAMLPYPNVKLQNRFTVSLLPIALEGSASNRLKSIYETFKALEAAPDIPLTFLSMKVIGLFPAVVTKFFSNMCSATLLVSNIPGPVEQCTVFGGCNWVDMSAWAPIRFGTGIGVGFYSYAGKVRACVVADSSCMSEPQDDVSMLIQGFEKEILELCLSSGVPRQNVFVD